MFKLKKLRNFINLNSPFLLTGIFSLFLVVPMIFQVQHVWRNLEPYPDGLIYVTLSKNLIEHNAFNLDRANFSMKPFVPPLYPILLAPSYLVTRSTSAYLLVNIFLWLLSLYLLQTLVFQITKNKFVTFITLAATLSHLGLIWTIGLPLIEILLFFLVMLALTQLNTQSSYAHVILTAIIAASLAFSKYQTLPLVVWISLFFLYKQYKEKNWLHLILYVFLGLLFASLFLFYQKHYAFDVFSVVSSSVLYKIGNSEQAFSLNYFAPHALDYLRSLIGYPKFFLWLKTPLSTIFLFLPSGLGLWWKLRSKEEQGKSIATAAVGLFIAHFGLLPFFYSFDLRYMITLIVPILLGFAFFCEHLLITRSFKFSAVIIVVLIGLHLLWQFPLAKLLMAQNFLGRSTAWQYESVQQFNFTFNSTQALVITALPPYLIDLYQTGNYRALPLSIHQEYIQRDQYVWGTDVPYDNLLAGYRRWLEEGKVLYISNAYITHQQVVIEDYEKYKEHFKLELVAEGCQQACNVYKLSL